ncbi:MAG: ABC transporter permease subunit [Thermoprotei archaeon]
MKEKIERPERFAPLFLALPFIIYLLLFTVYPIVESVVFSFSKISPFFAFQGFDGLRNYSIMIADAFFDKVFINTLIFVAAVTSADLGLALLLALAVDVIKRGRSFFTAILVSPMLLPAVVAAVVWQIIYDPFVGPLDFMLHALGLPRIGWLSNPSVELWSLSLVAIWQTVPFAFLLILAGLQSIPPQLKEASEVDGFSTLQRFRELTLPLLKPALIVTVLMSMITAFRTFDVVFVFNSGGFNPYNSVLAYYAYSNAFVRGYQGEAMAMVTVLAVISTVLSLLFIRTVGLRERLGLSKVAEVKKTKEKRRIRPYAFDLNLPHKLVLFTAYLILAVLGIFAFFPIIWTFITSLHASGVVINMLPSRPWLGYKNYVEAIEQGAPYLISSFIIAPVVAVATILLAAPAAYSIARYKLGGTKLLAWSLYLYTIPSIVYLVPLYSLVTKLNLLNTWWALMLIYPVFTLPLSVWILVGFYNDIPKEIDEAAQVDGKTKIQAFFDVILPIVRPALAVAAFFAIIASYSEFMFAVTIGASAYAFNFPPTGTETATVFVAEALTFGSGQVTNYALLGAAGLIVALPIMVISVILQKYIIKGLWFGSVKGRTSLRPNTIAVFEHENFSFIN